MSLMNSSKLISHILGYLRITKKLDSINNILNIESIIEECLTELEEINSFKYIYRKYNHKLEFLEDCTYDSLFEKSDDSYYLIACTLGYEVEQIKMEVPELQSDLIEDVAKYSAKWASDKLKCDVLKNDSGLCVDALNGFPGPYTHYVDDTLKEDGILKLLDGVENRNAHFEEVLAYCEYGKEPVIFKSITNAG